MNVYELTRIRLINGTFFKTPPLHKLQPYYIKVNSTDVYVTSPMETLDINFDKQTAIYKILK